MLNRFNVVVDSVGNHKVGRVVKSHVFLFEIKL